MPLPQGFSEWEFLQDLIRKVQNKKIREKFSDLGDENWDADINVARGALRHACTLKDQDTATMTELRLRLFYDILEYGKDNLALVYGSTFSPMEEHLGDNPRVTLYFAQNKNAAPEGRKPIDAEISFRLTNETFSTITRAKTEILAKKIKDTLVFGNNSYSFNKGKRISTYKDLKNGYRFKVYTNTEEEGTEVIKKVLSIQDHLYDDNLRRCSNPGKESVNNPPGTNLVYGKRIKEKRWRPTGLVYFRWAYLWVPNLEYLVTLVDTTGTFLDTIER